MSSSTETRILKMQENSDIMEHAASAVCLENSWEWGDFFYSCHCVLGEVSTVVAKCEELLFYFPVTFSH